ncbi:MAG: HAD-IA family hydrolase [Arachnia sp.]
MHNTVIFDIGQVIISWVPQRAFEQVMPADEVPAFMARIGFAEWNHANDARPDTTAATEELAALHPEDADGIRAYVEHFGATITDPVPGTAALIAELQAAGVTVGALTNWAGDTFQVAPPMHGVLRRLSDIVVSGLEGVTKPQPEIFQLACTRLGVDPAEAVFVDDSLPNVEGAAAIGMTGIHFRSAEQVRDELVALGLLGPRVPVDEPFYHWALVDRWREAQQTGSYPWSSREAGLNDEGFVHGSFAHQVADTRARFYGDLADDAVVLLRLDPSPELPILVEGGFPHLYAPLPVRAMTEVVDPIS